MSSLEALKAEVINHLKKLEMKENADELKKASEYFSCSENMFTYLEKSENGTWIEKAGYGVGTVRIWKGKKYKKVSATPTRWVRVFDKETRGAKSSMTRLIHKVQMCTTADELYQFCMSNHALFQDENGVDLPIMEKLRDAINERKNTTGTEVGKDTSTPNEQNEDKKAEINSFKAPSKIEGLTEGGNFKAELKANSLKITGLLDGSLKKIYKNITSFNALQPNKKFEVHKLEQAGKITAADRPNVFEADGKWYLLKKGSGLQTIGEHKYSNTDSIILLSGNDKKENAKTEKERAERAAFEKDRDDFIERMDKIRQNEQKKDSKVLSNGKTEKETTWDDLSEKEKNNKKSDYVKEIVDKTDRYTSKDYENLKAQVLDGKTGLIGGGDDIPKEERAAILQSLVDSMKKDEEAKNKKDVKNKADDKLIKLEEKLSKLKSKDIELTLKNNGRWGDGMRLSKLPSYSSWEKNREKIKEVENEIKKIEADNEKKQNEKKDIYWIQDRKGNRITNLDAKEILINNLNRLGNITNNLSNKLTKDEEMKLLGEKLDLLKENQFLTERLNSNDRKEMESEQEKHKNRSDAMKGNDNAKKDTLIESNKVSETKKDGAKPTITFDRNGRLGEKAVNTKLSPENVKALNNYPSKFGDDRRYFMKYPSEVELDGEKKLAYTDGHFLVITHDIPEGVKTKQTEKIDGNYPNVSKVIPEGFSDGTASKVDINIDDVMDDLPKVGFAYKNFNDDSQRQFMKIGSHWYDAKQVKAVYDMLKGPNAVVVEKTNDGSKFGSLGIKTDKGYSVIMSLSDDNADNYSKQSIYDSDKGSMSKEDKNAYELKKKTGLADTYYNNAVEFGYKPDSKGFMYGSNKDIGFKAKGNNTEFYYKGVKTGITYKSTYMYGTKENLDNYVDDVKIKIEKRINSYKDGKKEPYIMNKEYDPSFKNFSDEELKNIYTWWNNPKNIEEAVYKDSWKTTVPGLGSSGGTAERIGKAEDSVMGMMPDIEKEIQKRGISIRKSMEGEFLFEADVNNYLRNSIIILKKSLIF